MSYDLRRLDAVWDDLPLVPIPGLTGRWLAPLVDAGLAEWVSDLSAAAYGYLEEDSSWRNVLEEAPVMLKGDGDFNPAWVEAIEIAAGRLASAGSYAGPESDRERWVSWLLWELSEPHRWLASQLDELVAE